MSTSRPDPTPADTGVSSVTMIPATEMLTRGEDMVKYIHLLKQKFLVVFSFMKLYHLIENPTITIYNITCNMISSFYYASNSRKKIYSSQKTWIKNIFEIFDERSVNRNDDQCEL